MAVSKVTYFNNTLIDLTSDTISSDVLYEGYTAHDASGTSIVGTAVDQRMNVTSGSSAITANSLIISSDGTYRIYDGEAFSLTYPILYAKSNISANSSGNDNYFNATFTYNNLIVNKPVYIRGTMSGNNFEPVEITQNVVNYNNRADFTEVDAGVVDGSANHYLLLGIATATDKCTLVPNHDVYMFINRTFMSINQWLGRIDTDEYTWGDLKYGPFTWGELLTLTTKKAPRSPLLSVHSNYTEGYVNNGTWKYSNPSDYYCDIYEVEKDHKYQIMLGNTIGTRFNAMFTQTDVRNVTSDVTGTSVINTSSPAANMSVTYTPTADGYIIVDKGTSSSVNTYILDLAEFV